MSNSRLVCMIWREEAIESDVYPFNVDIVRSQETLYVGSKSLGGLFKAIRDNKHLIVPDHAVDSES